MTAVTLNGHDYSTDGSASRDMQGGDGYGFQSWLIPMFQDALTDFSAKLANANSYATAAGSALPVTKYAWDTGTSDADPGTGKLRANNTVLASATTLYLSTSDTIGVSVSAIIDAYDDSTSTTKGYLAIGHRTDPTKWVIYGVSGSVLTATGYRKVTVAYVAGPGGFSAADPVAVGFARTGDKGDTGATGGLSGGNLTGALNETAVTLAAASTTDIGSAAGNAVLVTGAAAIGSLGSAQLGARRHLTFSGAPTLVHNATSLVLPTAATLSVSAGDTASFESLGSGNWRCTNYQRADGKPLASGFVGPFSDFTVLTGATTVTASAHLGKMLVCMGTPPYTVTLPSPYTFGKGSFGLHNRSVGYVVVSAGGTNLNGTSSLGLKPGQSLTVVSDGSSYNASGQSGSSSTSAWNPSDKSSTITLSNNNLTATGSTGAVGSVRATNGVSVGVYYWEYLVTTADNSFVGVMNTTANVNQYIGYDANGWGYWSSNGNKFNNNTGSGVAYGSTYGNNDVVGVVLNMNLGHIYFSVNNIWQGGGNPIAGTNPAFSGISGTVFPAFSDGSLSSVPVGTARFSASSWSYYPPIGDSLL